MKTYYQAVPVSERLPEKPEAGCIIPATVSYNNGILFDCYYDGYNFLTYFPDHKEVVNPTHWLEEITVTPAVSDEEIDENFDSDGWHYDKAIELRDRLSIVIAEQQKEIKRLKDLVSDCRGMIVRKTNEIKALKGGYDENV